MKRLHYFRLVIVLAVILTAFSCTKDNNNSEEGYYFKAKINGSKTQAILHHAAIGEANGKAILFLYGRWGEKLVHGIDIKHFGFPRAAGSYTIDNKAEMVKASYRTNEELFNSSQGKLMIESITDNTIKGTFEFTSGDATITEGEFYLPLLNVGTVNTPEIDVEIKSILSEIKPEDLERLKEGGMAIHEGNNPPNIEGIYLSSPHILMQPYPGDNYKKGHQWNDYTYRISTQKNGHATLDYKAADANLSGAGVYITGSANRFTLYARMYGQEKNVKNANIVVLSGEVTPEGIKNFTSSYVLIWKQGDSSNTILMPVGAHRVSGDKDGMAQRVSTY
ncbi:hypothetical protein CAPN001_10450 [Capnocytophaga stomatis]|uniref:hypothetical protein n=1 Tax=Capnocytophaga stomatis TaxID=1848904 RepID=UPI00194F596C|nr:hypothetical protein [Capnocytophaga stomatis]GIJ93345.1 hypothetical protein CAPN002_05630 [Capnocytophaga stomatis]GIJ96476.1 hypothetical protein CAPN001_10450 [Capnocytophaga stomatis]